MGKGTQLSNPLFHSHIAYDIRLLCLNIVELIELIPYKFHKNNVFYDFTEPICENAADRLVYTELCNDRPFAFSGESSDVKA